MATRKSASKGKKNPRNVDDGIPEPIARQLLKLLSTDDGFRRRFKRNPTAGLLEAAGVSPRAAKCATPHTLASKRVIAGAHDDILDSLTKCLAEQPVQMDTGRG